MFEGLIGHNDFSAVKIGKHAVTDKRNSLGDFQRAWRKIIVNIFFLKISKKHTGEKKSFRISVTYIIISSVLLF